MPSGYYKESRSLIEDDVEDDESLIDEIDFNNKTILVIGCEPRRKTYQKAIEKRNGQMIWASGNESLDRLERLVMQVDCVVLITLHMAHYGSTSAVMYCKEHNIPFDKAKTRGIKSVIHTAYSILQETKKHTA